MTSTPAQVSSIFLIYVVHLADVRQQQRDIFNKIYEKMEPHGIPQQKYVPIGMDYTSDNFEEKNSVKTRVIQEVNSCYFVGYPFHLVHNLACWELDEFQSIVGFDVEDFCVNIIQ